MTVIIAVVVGVGGEVDVPVGVAGDGEVFGVEAVVVVAAEHGQIGQVGGAANAR